MAVLNNTLKVLATCCLLVSAIACSRLHPQPYALDSQEYYEKVHGAWLGKLAGGALGMPIEGWNYKDIEKAHGPAITGYIGYFDEIVAQSTEPVASAPIPADAQWGPLQVTVTVPEYDARLYHACPIFGIAAEDGTQDAVIEMVDLKIQGPVQLPALAPGVWAGYFAWVDQENKGIFDFKKSYGSQWMRMPAHLTRNIRLVPGQQFEISARVRAASGSIAKLSVAFDLIKNDITPGFGPDDDTSYQIIGLLALEKYGPDLSAQQIGYEWTQKLDFISPMLAEGLALERLREGMQPPQTGEHSMCEAIGGQMRAEIWGLVCPGRPGLAAEYARRDGVIAHARNGVYGEQFVAAMIAAAFTEDNVEDLIQTGLHYIPADSEYAQIVRWMIQLHEQNPDYRDTRRVLIEKYPKICNPVFAEAGIITLSLLYGQGDFDKTLQIAASCGQDTDCNAATVGAVIGCMRGERVIGQAWRQPLANQFRCFVKGSENWAIDELSRRTCQAGQAVQQHHGRGMKFSSEL